MPDHDDRPRIVLGHVVGVHGIKGEVVVKTYTEQPDGLGAYGPLADADGTGRYVVESLRLAAKGALVRFKGIADRTAAEGLKGKALTVARDALPAAALDQYYHSDLIGALAVTPLGETIGEIVAMQNFGAGDLVEIRLAGQRHTELVPFRDAFIPKIDIAARRVTVIMPEMIGDQEEERDSANRQDGST